MAWTVPQLFRSLSSGQRQRRRLTFEMLEERTLLSVFTLPQSVLMPNGATPQSVAVADFDGDGTPDVAVANNGTHTVGVLLNAGNGNFQPLTSYNVNNNPTEVISADLNGDGKPDLIVVNNTSPGTVQVLLNNGNGTFGTPTAYNVGNNPAGVVAVDLNNDGFPDLVVTNKTDNTVSVLLNNGKGAFSAATTVSVPSSPTAITAGDFKGNGNQDVAIIANGQVDVLYGNGSGGFNATQATFSCGFTPAAIVSGDFNKDGKPDLAVADAFPSNNGVAVLLNNGSGAFASPVFYNVGAAPSAIAVGDVNGDGNLDLVTADGGFAANYVSVILGNGDGTFGHLTNWVADQQPVSIAIGDFNGDQKPDLVVANSGSNDLSFLTGNNDGTFLSPRVNANISSPAPVVTGVFTGNGKQDIIIGNTSSLTGTVLTEMLGNGDGTFQTPTTINSNIVTPPLGQAVALVAADLNGDGKLDLVMLDSNKNVDVFLGNGDGTFQTPSVYAAGASPKGMAIGDFTGNGHPDIAVINTASGSGDGTVTILLNNGHGIFSPFATAADAGLTPTAVAAADFNGDGKADLVVTNNNGFSSTVSILTSNGDGSFKAPVTYAVEADPTAVAVGDLNGDGKPDLAVTNFLGQGLDILLNNGDGTFGSARFYTTGSNPTGVLLGDFMNQGHTDVVTTNDFGDSLTLWTNPGTGLLTGPLTFPVGDRPALSAAADFTGNGLVDLVTTNGNANSITVLIRTQTPAITSASSASFTAGTPGSFTVTATGSPTPTLSESGNLPGGVTFSPSTGVLSGTPAAGTGGTYNLTFSATNGVGTPASQSFTLTVNQTPAITSAGSATFTVSEQGTFTLTATGTPTPTLSETGNLPGGVTFSPSTGVLSGTPAAGTNGTYNLTFSATNGVGTPASQSFTLTVNPFVAATISGTVFQDINTNGVQNPGEPGLSGQTVFLDLTGSGTLAAGDPTATTDANGNYQFTVNSAGTYTVREVLLGGVLLAAPASGSNQVTVTSGANITSQNFADVPTSITVPLTLPLATPFPKQGNANADYVEALYRAILNRDAEPTGLAFWTGVLNSGTPRLQVVQAIRQSPEHFTQEVTAFYFTLLNRAPDPVGLQNWVQALETGSLTEEQEAFDFLNSGEYLSKGDKYFVDHMYLSLLGRSFDAVGEAHWLDALGDDPSGNPTHPAGATHAEVITDFLYSTESLTRLVQGYYQIFLQRLADPFGLNSWLGALQQGGSFLAIGQGFLSSGEFYNQAAAQG
jgi:hypothetical protein